MIDWLTISIDITKLNPSTRKRLDAYSEKIVKIAEGGEIKWTTGCFQSLRSDMSGLAWSFGNRLTLAGSPASIIHTNNVFGTSDIIWAFRYMRDFFEQHMWVELPDIEHWSCSRIDVTHNYDLGGQIAVSQALEYFRQCPTRGNNVERRHSTVYWNKSSTIRSGKAYNKYEHAKNMTSKNRAYYTKEQLEVTKRLLRLELKLGRHWIAKQLREHGIAWHQMTETYLNNAHSDFFEDLTNDIEVPTLDNLLDKLIEVCPTEGQAKAAFGYYNTIRSIGSESAKRTTTKATHYRHIKNLKAAGLTTADITSGEILSFRPQYITMKPVSTWDDLVA